MCDVSNQLKITLMFGRKTRVEVSMPGLWRIFSENIRNPPKLV